ncbi:MAG: hypothetical protein R3C45_11570 [Phycisphaerales bacterium]
MPTKRQHEADDDTPRLAIRRHTDRCFHMVEEVVPEGPIGDRPAGTPPVRGGIIPGGVRGYIVDGVMIDADDVAEVREVPGEGGGPDCLGTNDSRQG